MNNKIIPKDGHKDFSKVYEINSWRNFASRITKNPFVKEFLIKRDGDNCQWCNIKLESHFVIHHISYDHSCTFNEILVYNRPTAKRPNRQIIAPHCERCMMDNQDRFIECSNKLVLVHSPCNWVISKISSKG